MSPDQAARGKVRTWVTSQWKLCPSRVNSQRKSTVWRWLEREAKYQDGARTAADNSKHTPGPSLVAASRLNGLAVTDRAGVPLGKCVEALIDLESAAISYIVVASRNSVGLDEELRGVARDSCNFGANAITFTLDAIAFGRIPLLADRNWPARL